MECAFVGCGAVAEKYAAALDASSLSPVAVCDLDADRASSFAADAGATAYTDLEAMLDTTDAPLVVNLTSHASHAAVTEQALRAGRHVWSEKPLALDAERARDLITLATERELALGCAPTNPDGEAQRLARRAVDDGRLGPVRLAYAHAHVGRVTEWHDDPDSFLQVGPLYDGAVYPLTLLVAWFGPVRRVRTADAVDPWPAREGRRPERPSHVEATFEFAAGPLVRLTASFYAPHRSREFTSLELHGDDASLYLDAAGALGGDGSGHVSVGRQGRDYTPNPLTAPSRRTPYLAGPERLAASVRRGRPARDAARRGAHVVAVCNAVERAAQRGETAAVDAFGVATADGREVVWGASDGDDPDAGGVVSPPNASLHLPPVGFGCSRYRDGTYVDRRDSIERALDAGYRFLDSAELYGNEARIGEILAAPGSPDREALFVASKAWNTNHAHVAEACETTLADLGLDYLDCYMLHWPESWAYTGPLRRLAALPVETQEALTFPETDEGDRAIADVSLESAWRRLEAVHDRGLATTLGICNVDRETLADLVAFARVPPAIVQVACHPYRPRTELVEWCHERGIRVVAHSPLSVPGLLDDPVVTDVAAEMGVSPAAAIVAWHVSRGVVPIPASVDADHVVENLAAAQHRLPERARDRFAALEDPEFER
jgi:diketogulonate reductase-like aldo/keto reductase/predicted dehydrogenase